MHSTKAIRAISPYKPVRQAALFSQGRAVKLDWNESDVAPPKVVKDAMIKFINNGQMHWYPDIDAVVLREKLSQYVGLPMDLIQVFPGSDTALDYIARAYVEAGDEVVVPYPAYDNFRIYVESIGGRLTKVVNENPLEKNVRLILDALSSEVKLIYLITPNNPTGVIYDAVDVALICEALKSGMVVVDEAYFEFCGKTVVDLVQKYKNLIVVRSFSKAWALANLRCGYVISDVENINTLNKIRNGKNLSTLAQVACIAALDNSQYMTKYVEMVAENKTFLSGELSKLGIENYMCEGNFVLAKFAQGAEGVVDFLASKNIFVRNQSSQPSMRGFVRISIGTLDSLNILISALKEYVSK